MNTTTFSHVDVDRRLLRLVKVCVAKIDTHPELIEVMRGSVTRWSAAQLRAEWEELLSRPWPELRALILEDSERGRLRRQNAPLGGILRPSERRELLHTGS